ncbi:MAG: thiamine pyrophosphate-dependent enzyme [Myxococcota bacterium]
MRSELVLGDEAIALAALDAGIAGAFSYPGTPATEIFEAIEAAAVPDVSALWSANEKVAFEEALGMSYSGRRALVSMKHVGLNVAADPFMSSALPGVNGGLVLVVADDPGMHSSQNEQDSRFYGEFARVPLFEPSDQQQCYDLTREAFELSERLALPVMIRLVTRLAHSRAIVRRAPGVGPSGDGRAPPPGDAEARRDPKRWTLIPANARRRYQHLLDLQAELERHADESPWNALTLAGPRGIIACGIGVNYVREVLGEGPSGGARDSILELRVYPPPRGKLRQLVDHCEDILVVEDGQPFIEARLGGLLGLPGKTIRGRLSGDLPEAGELTPDSVARALGRGGHASFDAVRDIPGRPPALCKGCPHIDTFGALTEAVAGFEHPILFSDIGCYTLGCLPPYEAVHSAVDMGASIAMASGAARAGAHPVLCTIGDSTFTHSGMTPLIGAAHYDANMTVIILDNATTGMTGQQDSLAHGPALVQLLEGLGVAREHLHVIEPLARHKLDFVALLRKEIAHPGLSVIVAERACIHVRRKQAAGAARE